MYPKVHVVMVSAQATPNLTPALDSQLKPDEMVLVISKDMEKQAKWLTAALSDTGIRISRWQIADAWDIEHIRDCMLDLLAEREGQSLCLNARYPSRSLHCLRHLRMWLKITSGI